MNQLKIIFTGPVGAGKTTAISTISDIEPVKTEASATENFHSNKKDTTVAMDYGLLNLDDGNIIHLYGTPGQKRFDFMWEILQEGAVGLILLIDDSAPTRFEDLQQFLTSFKSFVEKTSLAIGITHTDSGSGKPISEYTSQLSQFGVIAPVFSVDPREKRDISMLVEALVYSIIPNLEE